MVISIILALLLANYWQFRIILKLINLLRSTTLSAARISFKFEGKRVTKMNLKVSQQLPVTIVAEDKYGNATGAVDAPPQWSLTDPSLGDVVVADGGMSAVVKPNGKLGSCELHVLAQADGKSIEGSLAIEMIPGDATQVVIQAGAPVDQPEASQPSA